jgi:transposase
VSLKCSSLCVVDASGKIIGEGKVESDPAALISWFAALGVSLARIGLEAGPLSQWLFAALRQAGLAVELLETRHVHNAFKTMPVKTDRKDARGIAQLMRLGWYRPVHCKSLAAQETRAILTARKLVQSKLHDVEMSLRGILRGFGLKVGPTTPRRFEGRIKELVSGQPNLEFVAAALLSVRAALLREFSAFEKRVRAVARCDARAAVDDGAERRRDCGAHLCVCHRRSVAVQVVQERRRPFRHDAEEVSVRRDRRHRPDLEDRRR